MPQRNHKGQFAPGNQAARGHGRPRNVDRARLMSIFNEELTDEKARKLFRTAIDKAVKGDMRAVEWVADISLNNELAQRLDALERQLGIEPDGAGEEYDYETTRQGEAVRSGGGQQGGQDGDPGPLAGWSGNMAPGTAGAD